MRDKAGKIFFGIAVISAILCAATDLILDGFLQLEYAYIFWFIGICGFVIGAVGTIATSKKLRKKLFDLLDWL